MGVFIIFPRAVEIETWKVITLVRIHFHASSEKNSALPSVQTQGKNKGGRTSCGMRLVDYSIIYQE